MDKISSESSIRRVSVETEASLASTMLIESVDNSSQPATSISRSPVSSILSKSDQLTAKQINRLFFKHVAREFVILSCAGTVIGSSVGLLALGFIYFLATYVVHFN
jgi:hypothetical protein